MKKILVIEDDEALCWLLQRILSVKYEVTIMRNGMDGMNWLLNGNTPDLIVSDLNMPSLDGIELMQKIRFSGFLRGIPVMILSGDQNPAKKKQCMDLGAARYIMKPFEPSFVLSEVENVLGARITDPILTISN
jgi:two-component system, chemotaxis family, chemotaxis protein CheY